MSIRDVGSYIGHNRVTTTSQDSASGIWSLAAVERRRRAAAWPVLVAQDPDFASVSLLLHMDGTGSTFTDSSGTPKTITASGNATQSTDQSRFGGKSAYFDGTGDYLTVSDEGQFDFSGDFTIEFFAYSSRTSGDQGGFFSKRASGTFGGVLLNHYGSSGNLQMLATADNASWAVNTTASAAMPVSTWAHIAVVRSGSTMTLYVDGVPKATGTISGAIANNSEPFVIGVGASNGAEAFTGYIDEFRVSKRARYLSAFTPPSAAFPDAGPFPVAGLQLWLDASDASTLYGATSGGSLVAADGGVARWEDKSGNGRHATQGTSANRPVRKTAIQGGKDVLRFDGSNDFLSIPSSTATFKFLHGGSTGYTAFAVVSPRALNTRERILETGRWGSPGGDAAGIGASWNINSNGSFRYDAAAGATNVIANASSTSLIAAGSWWVLGVSGIANSGTASLRSSMRINGGTAISNNTQTGEASNSNARTDLTIARGIGYNSDGSLEYEEFADLDIAEIIIYNSALSDANRQAVENYLMTKWGIA